MEMTGPVLIVICGIVFLVVGGRRLWQYHVVQSWSTTEGTLVEVSTGTARERIKYSDLTYVFPIAAYQYSVQGHVYQSERLSIDPKSVWLSAESVDLAPWKHWKPGAPIPVHFDSARPDRSVVFPKLHPHRRSHFLALVLAGFLIILAGVGVAILKG